jgi:3-oxoacyl-[acyl-carrier protein] reductase
MQKSRKTAVITGASGGIGRATARLLAGTGVDLILHGHANRSSLESLVAELKSQHPEVNTTVVYADLSQEMEQEQFIQAVSSICPSPDILVLAAGCDLMNPAIKYLLFDERLARLWQVDVVSAMRLSRFFGERMKATAGAIVFFGWDGVEYGMAGETAQLYTMAKGAVQGFSRSLAKSLAPKVRINCIAPGCIKTTWGETASSATDERVAAESLAQRWGTAEEIAEIVRFLVSDAAAYINNQTLHVNGGRGDFGIASGSRNRNET